MTVTNVWGCDSCQQDIPPEQHEAMLRLIVPNRVEGELHFCDWPCASQYAAGQVPKPAKARKAKAAK